MEKLNKVFTDYHLYLVILGCITNLAFIVITKLYSEKEGVTITFNKALFLLISYLIIGLFSYVFFYDDIKIGSNKLSIMVGLSSYYFISKSITTLSK